MQILVLSCDKYEPCWKPFFSLLEKYYPEHPKTFLVTETKTCPYCETINVNSDKWGIRFKEALNQLTDDDVLVMLDDFFIRGPVDAERISKIKINNEIMCYNFEKDYRDPLIKLKEWDIQKNNQIYLNSCQPTVWNRKLLIERLDDNKTPQEWETTVINSPYIHFINNQGYIIDIGYRHQPLSIGWGITRGKIAKECISFLEKEGLADEIKHYYTIL